MANPTIKYYEQNAADHFRQTAALDLAALYQPFLKHLQPGAWVLDAGCGSGRDSKAFLNLGFKITAFDLSPKMTKLSSQFLRQEVLLLDFEHLHLSWQYEGIWASASLLHIERSKLVSVINKLIDYLAPKGIFYMSFKYGDKEYRKDGRYFNCLDESLFSQILLQIPRLRLKKLSTTSDVRSKHKGRWLNAYLLRLL
ncbi:MAG: methyltransferase domain-containing protein [Firmicutes bacterium]|nr:methyltransferase domain-containing protein [Bacillota bacterium]